MFGFDATPLPKTKVKQRRVTVKSPCRSDVQTEKENTTLSTVSQDQCLHSAVNATSSKGTPSVIEHSQVTVSLFNKSIKMSDQRLVCNLEFDKRTENCLCKGPWSMRIT